MTDNIIPFAKFQRPTDSRVWLADLSLFEDDGSFSASINGASVDVNMTDDCSLRHIADCLDTISFMARQEAEVLQKSEQGPALAVITVFADGTIRSRLDEERMVNQSQFEWLADCIELTGTAVRKGEL